MNKFATQLIGAAIGGAFGWFVGGVIVEIIRLKEEGPVLDNDIPDIDGTENDPIEEKDMDKETGHKAMSKKTKVKDYTKSFRKKDFSDLAQLAAKYNGGIVNEPAREEEEVEGLHDIDDWEEEPIEESDIQPISIISMDEFANAEGFETLTLNFYDDDVVTDEHDNPITRPNDILGEEFSVSFGELSNDEDVVYVRNLDKKTMYEIVRTNKNYAAPAPVRTPKRSLADIRRAKQKEEEDETGEDRID